MWGGLSNLPVPDGLESPPGKPWTTLSQQHWRGMIPPPLFSE